MNWLLHLFSLCLYFSVIQCQDVVGDVPELYTIEGKVYPPDAAASGNWQINTRVLANGGEYIGFLRNDGSFIINNLPSGSYLVEAINPDFSYEPTRVDINSKGKVRARKVNHIQTFQVFPVIYPLKMKAFAVNRYFQVREQWRVTDFLMSPMVLMMILPLVLIMVLSRVMNDPETRKELEQLNNSMKYEMPDFTEMLTSKFSDKQKPKSVKASKKK